MKKIIPIFLIMFCITACDFSTSKRKHSSNHISSAEVSEATLFLPGIVSTNHSEFDLIFTPDNKTVFFTRRVGEGKQKIYTSSYQNGAWSTPGIASFSTDRDEYPNITPDGKTIYFGSERAIPGRPNKGSFDTNIWKTEQVNGVWSTPKPLDAMINKIQKEGEEWPLHNENHFNTSDGRTFYLCTQLRREKGIDIYETQLEGETFSKPKKLSSNINLEDKWEYAPKLSPDGTYLFFQSYNRKDGKGGDDIYVSKKDAEGKWLPAVNLVKLNTERNECPTGMTSDGKYMFFTRNILRNPEDDYGISSIYFIETKYLELEKLFKS